MLNRIRLTFVTGILLVLASLLIYVVASRHTTERTAGVTEPGMVETVTNNPTVIFADNEPAQTNGPTASKILRVRSDQVLASVNGRHLKLQDVLPAPSSNLETERNVAADVYEYFLQRAINRALILQVAASSRVQLNESQRQQFARFRASREQPEAGLLEKLNVDEAQIQFELQEAEAFLVQTSLLARIGASPNVTSDQVMDHYRKHAAELGALPTDEHLRREAWQRIDLQIREELAASVRSNFQNQLVAYMDQIRSEAEIVLYPPRGSGSPE